MTMQDAPSSLAAQAEALLRAGLEAAQAGDRGRARELLARAVAKDRRNALAWLSLSAVVDGPEEKEYCLQKVLALDPGNEQARQALDRLRQTPSAQEVPAPLAERVPSAEEVPVPIREEEPVPAAQDEPLPGGDEGLPRAQAKEPRERGLWPNEFTPIAALGLVLVLLIGLDTAWGSLPTPLALLRLLLGLPSVLFVPGYALQAALFPRAEALEGPERLALSFGLSVAVVPPLALLLDALPWGIRLWPIVVAEGLVIAVCSAVALWRRARLPVEDRIRVRLEVDVRGWWAEQDRTGRILYGVLAFAFLLAAGSAIAIAVLPKPGEHFTEFYVLGSEGLAESYPREVAAGESISVTAGIANREGVRAEYRIEVRTEDQLIGAVGPLALEDGEVWEGPVEYALPGVGDDQQVHLTLYRDEDPEPYRTLRLWVNVVEE